MSRRDRHRNKQQQISSPPVPSGSSETIKVLALGIGGLLLIVAMMNLVIGAFASDSATDVRATAAPTQLLGSPAPVNNGVQEVAVSMRGYQYQPDPIRLTIGVPARFTVDLNTVRGCMRSIQIPGLGVAGRVSDGNNVLEFTPTKAGTFRMTCSMGMADGTVIVEDENGNVPATDKSANLPRPAVGSSCGAGGGGCGCGG